MPPFEPATARWRLPEAIITDDLPTHRRPRLIATGYATTLNAAFSGSSYYLAEAGMAAGQIEGCFTLQSPLRPDHRLNALGALWKLGKLLRGQKKDGFKFAPAFHEHIWKKHAATLAGTDIINNIQMFGRSFWQQAAAFDLRAHFYIDGTLHEYFSAYADYDVVAGIDRATMAAAIEQEKEDYSRARHIFAMSGRSARTLTSFYGIAPERVSVVSPGANLPASLAGTQMAAQRQDDEFILGFVGLYPLRKGLDRLAAAVRILRSRHLPVKLHVVGRCPDEIRTMDGVEYQGEIRKSTHMAEFIRAIGRVHLGCQLSRAELVGIAPLEFLWLGIPILATDVGGVPELVADGGGLLVSPHISAEELADVIAPLVVDRDRYALLRQQAGTRREWARWSRTAGEIDAILATAS
ncbi:MAG: glycosyltransferase family 4 protein [Steroidobacteraceae bacterium]